MNATTKRLRLRLVTAAAVATALVGGAAAVPAAATATGASATTATADASTAASADHRLTEAELRREVARTLEDAGFIGITVEVRDGSRRIHARAGEAELNTGRPMPYGANYRAASVTKSFVATVVLQLVAEGRLSLSDPVEKWLPGVVSGNGNDGRLITVRNLLQHTSGVHNYDYSEDTGDSAEDFERTRFDHVSPEQVVAGAMRHRPDFPPAPADDPEPDWNYSNPGYVLAGMIIQKVTGRSWAQEVRDRIIRPLGLTGTYEPGDDPRLKAPYAHTYQRFPGSDSWTDTTFRNVSWGGAAGSLISTDRDLDRFFTALLRGRLLPPAQLAEMRRTVPVAEDFQVAFPHLRYGLGLMRQPLACGGYRWGHGGDLEGATVRTGFTEGGRRSVTISTSGKTADDEQVLRAEGALQGLIDRVLCDGAR
ncbi:MULTISPECIES: serine hydrolase domain-containing protein [Streptomyces]|uniref:D-alanyl-D-alanine carboxypeptidase n=1 Tax=Streptomyces demainii TaxID=588122 RepID=A0ABT9L179_9ACTN|nr:MULTISPECIES: serine hydrolase domain-containing protein [Streptomyces]MBW8087827.1 beta-lactamase family protein [Streptomyces hygroscopicus subsp. hygroscopicus]MCO8306538.1 beta-lactamase family protein [Streptomyces sp. RKCA744]MDP9614423.1 D-alanyl-D-alanine carboxypeptidase [Streptomyces demainii]